MKKKLRISTLCAAVSIPLILLTTNTFAQSHRSSYDRGYDYGYDDGYDDGYEDAMDDCPCPPHSLISGFYLGAGVGYEGFQVKQKPWVFDENIGSFNTHANGWNGKLFGGYGRYFNRFYLGGELFVNQSSASGTNSVYSLNYDQKFSVGTSYGLSLIPGFQIPGSNSLAYARIGYTQSDFTVKNSYGSMSSSYSHWTSGFNTGLGVEIPLYKKLSTRLEYDYINYSSFNNNGNNVGSKNSPADNRGSLDFVLRF